MNLTRRSFLTAIAAGAAALGLPGTVAKAEPAHDPWCPCRFDMAPAEVERLKREGQDSIEANERAITPQPGETFWGVELIDGAPPTAWLAPVVQETWVPAAPVWPLAFNLQQEECAGLGHRLRLEADGWTEHYMAIDGGYRWSYFEHWDEDHQGPGPTDRLARVNSWRRSLHQSGG